VYVPVCPTITFELNNLGTTQIFCTLVRLDTVQIKIIGQGPR